MNKKHITIIVILVVAAAGFGYFIYYLTNFHKVSFTKTPVVEKIEIFRRDPTERVTITDGSSPITLASGSYYAATLGSKVSREIVDFNVTSDTVVSLDPSYSETYLDSLLVSESAAIQTEIESTLPKTISNYTLTQSHLYKKGEWFGGVLVNKKADNNNPKDTYRVILKKDNESWSMTTTPMIIFSSAALPDVPIDVLRKVNALHADD